MGVAQGRPRALHPVVRDDVFRVAGEALRNAYRHADPKRVEVDVRYEERGIRGGATAPPEPPDP